jgi:hypothetical protein
MAWRDDSNGDTCAAKPFVDRHPKVFSFFSILIPCKPGRQAAKLPQAAFLLPLTNTCNGLCTCPWYVRKTRKDSH